MRYLQTHYERQKTALGYVLLVLFLLQTAVATIESAAQSSQSFETTGLVCTDSCIDVSDDSFDSNSFFGDEGVSHCDDCDHCLGCHLTALVYHITARPMFESQFRFTFLAGLTASLPTSIDRPPIA